MEPSSSLGGGVIEARSFIIITTNLLQIFFVCAVAIADPEPTPTPQATLNTQSSATPTPTPTPQATPSAKGAVANAENSRMQSIVGSPSRWSSHFTLTYTGPSLSKPFGADAPNPLMQIPAPQVNMQGTVSVRYRVDPTTTISFGTGLMVYTPFTAATGWSVADPYLNFNKLLTTGDIHHYIVTGINLWTDDQYASQDGYRLGFNFSDESYYVFKWGLTVGVDFWASANTFAANGNYDETQQDAWFIGGGPYVEYAFSERVSLRSVLGIQGDHAVSSPGSLLVWENPYQTLGVGVQIVKKALYMYTYVMATPYSPNFSLQNTGLGFNIIANLF